VAVTETGAVVLPGRSHWWTCPQYLLVWVVGKGDKVGSLEAACLVML